MLKHVALSLVAVAVLVGCGKEEGTSSGGGSSSGSGTGGGGASGASTPEQVFNDMKKHMLAGDGKAIWSFFSAASKKMLEEQTAARLKQVDKMPAEGQKSMADRAGITVDELKTISATDYTEKSMIKYFVESSKDPEERAKVEKSRFVSADVKADRAEVKTLDEKGEEEWAVMVREDGTWKLDMEQSQKLTAEKKK